MTAMEGNVKSSFSKLSGLRVDDLVLDALVGQGGMGDVWRARNVENDEQVAVKIVTPWQQIGPDFRRSFRNEVRLMAGLRHPGLVSVYDHGELDETVAASTGGRYAAHTPYFVMEFVQGPTLRGEGSPKTWPELESVLLQLLEVLAHAHARGIIHRDIKPANLLLHRATGRLRLCDFGIARFIDDLDHAPEALALGTLGYMAPEQIRGAWREFGPWTDLYGVGAVAYTLATGSPPFRGSRDDVVTGHMHRVPPEMTPRFPLPDGFEAWVRLLLAKDVSHRPQFAADAARLFEALPGACENCVQSSDVQFDDAESTLVDTTTLGSPCGTVRENAPQGTDGACACLVPQGAGPETRLDADGCRDRGLPATVAPLPLGLSMFGLRAVPMIGRLEERELLWSALTDVRQSHESQAVIIQGGAGYGKTRLAEWLCHRAHETGIAYVLRAIHGTGSPAYDGPLPMLARLLRTTGLPEEQTWDRVRTLVQRLPQGMRPAWPVRFRHRAARDLQPSLCDEHVALLQAFLAALCQDRPVVVVIEDAVQGPASVELCVAALEHGLRNQPVLFLVLARDEDLADAPEVRCLFRELASTDRTRQIDIEALHGNERIMLLRSLIDVRGELAARIDEHTDGNPMCIVQLVEHLVQTSSLVLTKRGYELRPGTAVQCPGHFADLWRDRIEALLHDRSPDDRVAFEVAACLGLRLDPGEWRQACQAYGVVPSEDLVDALVRRRLLVVEPRGSSEVWTLSHAMVRTNLLRDSESHGRLASIHYAVAMTLARRTDPPSILRLGRHLLAAGEEETAIVPLLQGAELLHECGNLCGVEGTLRDARRAVEQAALPEWDARTGLLAVFEARLLRTQGRLVEAEKRLARISAHASEPSWHEVHVRAETERSVIESRRGRYDDAIARLEHLEERSRTMSPKLHLEIMLQLADTYSWHDVTVGEHAADAGRRHEAYSRALAEAKRLGDPRQLHASFALETWGSSEGDAVVDEAGVFPGPVSVPSDGRVAFAAAFEGKRLLESSRFEEARARLLVAYDLFDAHGRQDINTAVLAGLALVSAHVGEWDEHDRLIRHARAAQEETRAVLPLMIDVLQQAAVVAGEAGEPVRAAMALAFAADLHRQAGNRRAACAVEAEVDRIWQELA